jgi:hypothetical protein
MASPSRPSVIAVAAATVVVLGALWLLWGRVDTRVPRQAEGAVHGPEASATLGDASQAALAPEVLAAAPPALLPPEPAPARAPEAGPGAAPTTASAPPRDGLDGPSWRNSRLAFRSRELGKMGPYVKAGLDAARRDMEFCFRQAGGAAAGAPGPAEDPDEAPPPRPSDPAILLLYLEARDGAMDVVDARTEHRGTSAPGLVECCREVLRGLEIKAFDTVPGQRYRVKFRLQ